MDSWASSGLTRTVARGRGCACPAGGFGFTDLARRMETLTRMEKELEPAIGVENGLLGRRRGLWMGECASPKRRLPPGSGRLTEGHWCAKTLTVL